MKNIVCLLILGCFCLSITACKPSTPSYKERSTAVVVLVGAHIKSKDCPIEHKYERKNCPVCKGTGWYLSGDGIKKVPCGYCEEPKPTSSGVKK